MSKREIENKSILDEFVIDFCNVIKNHCKYIVCSGFVAIAHGRSRGTEDIDMMITPLSFREFEKLHTDLLKHNFECLYSGSLVKLFNDYLIKFDSLRYVRKGTFLPEMELKFARDKLDLEQIKNRVKLPLTRLDVYFATVESNIAFKEEYLTSVKDMEDARHLMIIYEGKIDKNEIKRIKKEIRRVKL